MKAVVDTNVFISGIFWDGSPNKVISAWKDGKFELIISSEIIDELTAVLNDFEIKLPEDMSKEWINLVVRNSVLVEPKEKLQVVKDDPADNKFIEAAIEGKAKYIVTGDTHLKQINEFRGIRIVTAKKFLELL